MIKLWRLLGKVRMHPLFWLVAGTAMLTGYFWELFILFLIVFVHELGHAAAASYFSWKIKQILILPFGGKCEVDEHGNRPLKEELVIVLSGPLQHIWLGAAVFLLESAGLVSGEGAFIFHQFNTMVFLFNLLPVWPLDGGKLLYLFLSVKKPFLSAMRHTIISSAVILAILHFTVLLIYPLHLHLWIVMIYLYISLWLEWKQIQFVFMRFLLERYYGNNAGIKRLEIIEADGNEWIYHVMEKFQRGCKHLIHVDNIRSMDENEMLHAYFANKQVNIRLKEMIPEE
ncbi:M50 family metallopeptidase [Siminovitchia sediminis]|uniref:M50 family metallopeptidase n=1 Tax=Siminovitchia sediminis TaxID=1274353 RepID=A0ABW4KC51_9BACI